MRQCIASDSFLMVTWECPKRLPHATMALCMGVHGAMTMANAQTWSHKSISCHKVITLLHAKGQTRTQYASIASPVGLNQVS